VEFYDSKHDPIVEYFMEKMQVLVSNQNAINTFANVKALLSKGLLSRNFFKDNTLKGLSDDEDDTIDMKTK
jgi:hypothetical protein